MIVVAVPDFSLISNLHRQVELFVHSSMSVRRSLQVNLFTNHRSNTVLCSSDLESIENLESLDVEENTFKSPTLGGWVLG